MTIIFNIADFWIEIIEFNNISLGPGLTSTRQKFLKKNGRYCGGTIAIVGSENAIINLNPPILTKAGFTTPSFGDEITNIYGVIKNNTTTTISVQLQALIFLKK